MVLGLSIATITRGTSTRTSACAASVTINIMIDNFKELSTGIYSKGSQTVIPSRKGKVTRAALHSNNIVNP